MKRYRESECVCAGGHLEVRLGDALGTQEPLGAVRPGEWPDDDAAHPKLIVHGGRRGTVRRGRRGAVRRGVRDGAVRRGERDGAAR